MKLTIMRKIYKEIQNTANKYGRIIVAESYGDRVTIEVNEILEDRGSSIRVDCMYYKNAYGYSIDMTKYSGHTAVIPKFAIYK